jgi:GNAT superfamily N-acetyltransferase
MNTEPVTPQDLEAIKQLQPDGWADILPSIQFYIESAHCFPIKVVHEGTILGIGTTIIHGETAWLAHIIVDKDSRGKGIGTIITKSLVDSLRHTSCKTALLIATALGEPVYKKFGFKKETEYAYLKRDAPLTALPTAATAFQQKYQEEILAMDERISGEKRSWLLLPHLPDARLIVESGMLQGIYFPNLGDGLIIANTPDAGRALLQLKCSNDLKVALPIDNTVGLEFVTDQGYTQHLTGTRMWLGNPLRWHPDKLYNRIGGNLG